MNHIFVSNTFNINSISDSDDINELSGDDEQYYFNIIEEDNEISDSVTTSSTSPTLYSNHISSLNQLDIDNIFSLTVDDRDEYQPEVESQIGVIIDSKYNRITPDEKSKETESTGNVDSVMQNIDRYYDLDEITGNVDSLNQNIELSFDSDENTGNVDSLNQNIELSFYSDENTGNVDSLNRNIKLSFDSDENTGNVDSLNQNIKLSFDSDENTGNVDCAISNIDISNDSVENTENVDSMIQTIYLSLDSDENTGNVDCAISNIDISNDSVENTGNVDSMIQTIYLNFDSDENTGNVDGDIPTIDISDDSVENTGNDSEIPTIDISDDSDENTENVDSAIPNIVISNDSVKNTRQSKTSSTDSPVCLNNLQFIPNRERKFPIYYQSQIFIKLIAFLNGKTENDIVNPSTKTLKTTNGYQLYVKHLMSVITPREWLTDAAVQNYISLVVKNCDKTLEMTSDFLLGYKKRGYNAIFKWFKKYDLNNLNRIVFPINPKTNHWALIVVEIWKGEVYYFDSLKKKKIDLELELALSFFSQAVNDYVKYSGVKRTLPAKWKLVDGKSNLQSNSFDCGVFTCMNSRFYLLSRPRIFTQRDTPILRQLITWELINNALEHY